jgi:PAS domain S-box-containing protein
MTLSVLTTYLLLCLLAVGGMGVVAAAAWRARTTTAGRVALAAVGCVIGWLLSVILALLSPTASVALFWHQTVRFVFVALSTPLLVLFLAAYFGVPRLSRRLLAGLFIIPGLTIVLDLTNNWHHLFLAAYGMERVGPYFVRLTWTPGPWFPIYSVFYSGSLFVAVVSVLLAYRRRAPLYRAQARVFVWSLLPPTVLLVFDTLSRAPFALLGTAPLGFAAMALLQARVLRQHRLLDLVPVAREAMFSSMVDPVVALDRKGRIVDLNPAAEQVLGRSAGTALGAHIMDLAPRRLADLQAALEAAERGDASAQMLLDLGGDGEARSYDVRVSSFGRRPGVADGHMLVFHDVTKLKHAEARLAQQASRLEALFAAVTEGVAMYDAQGCIVQSNPAFHEMLGLSADSDYSARRYPERVAYLNARDQHGQPILYEQMLLTRALRGEVIPAEKAPDTTVTTRDGREVTLSRSAASIRDADGKIVGAVIVHRDVTARRQLERQVQEQASQLEAIFEAQADGVGVYDLQGRFVRANRALHQLYGFEAEGAFTTRPLSERAQRLQIYDEQGQRLPAEQWPHWRVLNGEILTGPTAMDTRVQTLDGREVWTNTTGAPIRGSDGEPMGVVLITRDVTAHRQLERQVAEQASQLEAIFETQADGVVLFDRQRRVVRANRAWRDILQRYAEMAGLTADPTYVALPLADQAEQLTLWDEHGRVIPHEETPTARALRGETVTGANAVDERVQSPDGRVLQVSVSAAPVRDVAGQVAGAVVVVQDVTARRQLEQRLTQQERQYRTLVEHSPDIITRFDRALHQLYVSPNAEAVLGIPSHERVGKTYAELGLPEALYAPWARALREVFATGESRAFDITSPYGEGDESTSYYRVRYVPEMGADASVESVLGITTDVSALRRTEAALRVAKAAADVARQGEEQRRREAELRGEIAESLREVLAILNSKRPLAEILYAITQQAGRLLGSAATAIYGTNGGSGRRDETGQPSTPAPDAVEALTLMAAFGLGEAQPDQLEQLPLSFASQALHSALAARWPVAVHNTCVPAREQEWAGDMEGTDTLFAVSNEPLPSPYQALLIVPIVVQEEVYGCLALYYTVQCRFLPEDVALAMAYGDQIALAIANARLQQHIEQDAIDAQRNWLARELHDTVTQEIFSASLLAQSIPRLWEPHPSAAEHALEELHKLTRSALAGLRMLLFELRPATLEQVPLPDLLRQLGEVMSTRSGAPVTVRIEGADALLLPTAVKLALYRVAQEALSNAARHARAHAISVQLRHRRTGRIVLAVEDDGNGFDPVHIPAGHFGLAMMRERAQDIGATLHVKSRPGTGTRVIAEWRPDAGVPSLVRAEAACGRVRLHAAAH